MSDMNQPDCDQSHEEGKAYPVSRIWKVTLAYDGTDFHGWQVQPDGPTVQGELQAALGRVTGETPLPQGSGRTDAGVHALGQVASFELQAPIPPENLRRAVNRTLPASIRILQAERASAGFHARHSTVAKTYEYRVFRGEICPPVLARYVYACPWPMDVKKLLESASHFAGHHDFASFAATDPDLATRTASASSKADNFEAGNDGAVRAEVSGLPAATGSTMRTIYSSAWEQRHTDAGELWVYRVRGRSFLHHMVRNLVGTMLDIGRGQLAISQIPEILAARSRSAAGPTAPARGLFLHSVEYGGEKAISDAG